VPSNPGDRFRCGLPRWNIVVVTIEAPIEMNYHP